MRPPSDATYRATASPTAFQTHPLQAVCASRFPKEVFLHPLIKLGPHGHRGNSNHLPPIWAARSQNHPWKDTAIWGRGCRAILHPAPPSTSAVPTCHLLQCLQGAGSGSCHVPAGASQHQAGTAGARLPSAPGEAEPGKGAGREEASIKLTRCS